MTEKQDNRNPEEDEAPMDGAALSVEAVPSRGVVLLKHLGGRIFRFFGESVAIVLGIAFVWFYAMNVFLGQKTTDVTFAKQNIGLWFSEAFDGQSADIGTMNIIWHPENNEIVLDVTDIVVKDKYRGPLQTVKQLRASFDFNDALMGQFTLKDVDVTGGSVTWMRQEDGQVVAGLGTPASVGAFGEMPTGSSQDRDENGDKVNRSFAMQGLQNVVVHNADVYVVDQPRGLDLHFEQADVSIADNGSNFSFQAKAGIGRTDGAAGAVDAKAQFSPDFEDFDLSVTAQDINPSEIIPSDGNTARFSRFDAPVSLTLDVIAKRDVGLEKVSLNLNAGAGTSQIGPNINYIKSLSLQTDYDPATGALNLNNFNLDGTAFKAVGDIKLGNIGRPATGFFNDAVSFDVDLSDVIFTASDTYDDPVVLKGIKLSGLANTPENLFEFNDINADFNAYSVVSNLSVSRDQGRTVKLNGSGQVEGVMTPQDLLSLWPKDFSAGTRNWIERAILTGDITDVEFNLDLDEADLSGGVRAEEDIRVAFTVSDADVKYVSTMTPYTDVTARGVLSGNSFELTSNKGRVGTLEVRSGHVSIPQIMPRGGDLIVKVTAAGSVQDMLRLTDEEPLNLARRYDLDIDGFEGAGVVDLTITRPLLTQYDRNLITYDIEGLFDGVAVPFSMGGHELKKGQFKLRANNKDVSLSGPVNFGPWRAQLEWQDQFTDDSKLARYRLTGPMDREALDGFGLGLREYFDGIIDVDIEASGKGLDLSGGALKADLTKADIRLGEYWHKAKGDKGVLSGVLSRTEGSGLEIKDLAINAPGLQINGFIDFETDMGLKTFQMDTVSIDDFADGTVRMTPNANRTAFIINMTGDHLDISPFVSEAIAVRESGVSLPMVLDAKINRLVLNEMFVLKDANFSMEHNGDGTKQGSLKGTLGGEAFLAEIAPNADNMGRTMTLDVPDASLAAMAFLNMDYIKGGRMQLRTILPETGKTGLMQGELTVDDVILVEAPIMAKILSLASLTGLADAMGGSGLKFEQASIPFSYEDGLLSVRDATASGPALGLTANGDIDIADKVLDVDGVLVPAYSANSALASIPILGDIFAGKKGEGIFALNYAVRGPFSASQVGVNPLSALTPGFLRGIFQPRRKALSDLKPDPEEAPRPVTPPSKPDE